MLSLFSRSIKSTAPSMTAIPLYIVPSRSMRLPLYIVLIPFERGDCLAFIFEECIDILPEVPVRGEVFIEIPLHSVIVNGSIIARQLPTPFERRHEPFVVFGRDHPFGLHDVHHILIASRVAEYEPV